MENDRISGHDREMDLFWSRMNQAVSSFCLSTVLDNKEKDKMVCALVGEELEWCGAHSYLFMASRYLEATSRSKFLEERYDEAETSRVEEANNAMDLRKSLKQTQVAAEDNEWQFQEQLAHTNNLLRIERQGAEELKSKILELKGKLVEVEMYLGSDKGAAVLRLEEELAATRLKLAEAEEERDRKELTQRLPLSPKRTYTSNVSSNSSNNNNNNRKASPQAMPMSLTKQMALNGARSVIGIGFDDNLSSGGGKENSNGYPRAVGSEMW
jgi:hypothetical protein